MAVDEQVVGEGSGQPRVGEKARVHFKLISICSIALLGSFSVGGVIAFTSPAIPSLNGNVNGTFYMTKTQESWFTSVAPLAIAVGAILAGYLSSVLGRKWTMLVGTLPFLTGWLIISSSEHVVWMYAGRSLTGLCSGLMMATVSVYVLEMAPDNRRGMYGSLHEVTVNLGILFTYVVGAFMVWQYLAITLASVIVVMVILAVYFLPETPRWLIVHGHSERAQKILGWIYTEQRLTEIWTDFEKSAGEKRAGPTPWMDLLRAPHRRKLFFCLTLFILQEMSGISIFRLYAVPIFNLAETHLHYNTEAIIVGAVGVLGSFLCAGLVDRVGKRCLLTLSMLLMGVCNLILGVYFLKSSDVKWVPLTSLIVFTLSYASAMGPLPYVVLGESFPISARSRCCALAVACQGICAFLVSKYFVVLGALLHNYVPFFVCGSMCLVGLIFIFVFLPCVVPTEESTDVHL